MRRRFITSEGQDESRDSWGSADRKETEERIYSDAHNFGGLIAFDIYCVLYVQMQPPKHLLPTEGFCAASQFPASYQSKPSQLRYINIMMHSHSDCLQKTNHALCFYLIFSVFIKGVRAHRSLGMIDTSA